MNIDIEELMEDYSSKLDDADYLCSVMEKLSEKDKRFASDLIMTLNNTGALSYKQWKWVKDLGGRVRGTEPLYGDYKAIRVAFMIAGEHLKVPKIRLMTDSGRYVQLNFYPNTSTIKVFVDGWQGHGYRKFAGLIEDDMIKPYNEDRMTSEVKKVIQELAMDPMGVAKAMANKLGCCMYCGKRLSDERSKQAGYGATCASNYNLPWGEMYDLFMAHNKKKDGPLFQQM